ncbi:hypothetical protein ACX0G9_29940 [Flavitalea flava]
MSIPRFLYSILAVLTLSFTEGKPVSPKMSSSLSVNERDLTVSYAISLKSKRSNTGFGETYNGGVKTVFISNDQIRLRLVSLMRMESIFILQKEKGVGIVTLVKESGKEKYKYSLTPEQWKGYNQKYDGQSCHLTNDTTKLLNYSCKKAIITLKTGETITAWYTPAIQPEGLSVAEPAFSGIPGLVLQYEYKYKKGTISYTATTISQNPIDKSVFTVPDKDVQQKKYIPVKSAH